MSRQSLKVIHLASGDRWAGAEVQLFTLLSQLKKRADIEPRAILLNEGELAQRLRAQHIPVDVLDESLLSSGAILLHMTSLLREYKPHILHTHRQKENILGSIANILSVRAKSVRTVHGANEYAATSLPQKIIERLDRWTGNHLQQKIIAVSPDLAQKLTSTFSSDRITVVENGVDVDAVRASIKPVELRESATNSIHIGIVGRLDPVKRIDIFLNMAKLLIEQQPPAAWHFHIFGEGAQELELKQSSINLGIESAVIFHGHRTDIASYLATLDAIVMCSDHEGLPMTVLESIAVGTPVLAHAVGGLQSVLADGAGGQLVCDHSPPGYAAALQRLLHRDRAELIQQGQQRLAERYSAAANADNISLLYRKIFH